jgi:uncharacterized membrane protein YphA (DoxX/SURF4 family)
MTPEAAFTALGCEVEVSLDATTQQYQTRYTEMQVRLDNAPTPQLKRLYQDRLHDIEAAYQMLKSLPRTAAVEVAASPLPSPSPPQDNGMSGVSMPQSERRTGLEAFFGKWHNAIPVIVRAVVVIVSFTFLQQWWKYMNLGMTLPFLFLLLGVVALFIGLKVRWVASLLCIPTVLTTLTCFFFYAGTSVNYNNYTASLLQHQLWLFRAFVSLNLFSSLLVLLILGAGPWSVDAVLCRKRQRRLQGDDHTTR